eukprot:s369_g30.t1
MYVATERNVQPCEGVTLCFRQAAVFGSHGPDMEPLLLLGNDGSPFQVSRVLATELQTWKRSPRKATTVLSHLAKRKLPDLAVHVLEVMRSNAVEVNSIHVSAVVSAAARCGQWILALQLLCSAELSSEPSVFAWNAAITACEAGDEWERALLLFDSMPAAKITPDHISMNAAISACKKGSNWLLATHLLRSFDGDVVSYGTAISACEKCGMWESALDLAREMQVGRISLDLVSYNATMSACEKGQAWQYALGSPVEAFSLCWIPGL